MYHLPERHMFHPEVPEGSGSPRKSWPYLLPLAPGPDYWAHPSTSPLLRWRQRFSNHPKKNRSSSHQSFSSWWFQTSWKICSSNWIIRPVKGENQKYLKPPPIRCCTPENRHAWNLKRSPKGKGETSIYKVPIFCSSKCLFQESTSLIGLYIPKNPDPSLE